MVIEIAAAEPARIATGDDTSVVSVAALMENVALPTGPVNVDNTNVDTPLAFVSSMRGWLTLPG